MALFGVLPEVMKPTALVLNFLVAVIVSLKFYRNGYFSWPVFWPFALSSIPFAFLGGSISLSGSAYEWIVSLALWGAACRLLKTSSGPVERDEVKNVQPWPALGIGAAIGLFSGLIGIGGGIFLSPLLLFLGWAEARQAAGVSAAFILVNSAAGLLGYFSSAAVLHPAIPFWMIAAGIGGWIGAEYGSRRLDSATLSRVLAVVLILAGLKMVVF